MGTNKGKKVIQINRPSRPWMRRLWEAAAKIRGQELQDMVIDLVDREARTLVPELDEKLRAIEALKEE